MKKLIVAISLSLISSLLLTTVAHAETKINSDHSTKIVIDGVVYGSEQGLEMVEGSAILDSGASATQFRYKTFTVSANNPAALPSGSE